MPECKFLLVAAGHTYSSQDILVEKICSKLVKIICASCKTRGLPFANLCKPDP